MRVENISLEAPQPKIFDFNVTVFEVDRTQYFSGSLNLLRNVDNLFGHYLIMTDSGNGKYDMVYLNKTFDLCDLLLTPRKNVLFNIAYKMASKFVATNIKGESIKKCPIQKVKLN